MVDAEMLPLIGALPECDTLPVELVKGDELVEGDPEPDTVSADAEYDALPESDRVCGEGVCTAVFVTVFICDPIAVADTLGYHDSDVLTDCVFEYKMREYVDDDVLDLDVEIDRV